MLPGGESTTLSMLLESSGLYEPLADALAGGLAVFGTCAGLVLLAREVHGGRPDQRSFAGARLRGAPQRLRPPVRVVRDLGGRPKISAELGVDDAPMAAVFIRAPVIESVGPAVEVLASLPGDGGAAVPVVCRQGNLLASAFHPELTADRRLHELFVSMAAA